MTNDIRLPVYFHELTDEQIVALKASRTTLRQAADQFKQPEWCGLADAVCECWGLVYQLVKDESYCGDCEYRRTTAP